MQQIRILATESTPVLRVRWDDDPQFWRELLIAGRGADEQGLAAPTSPKRLFCGELLECGSAKKESGEAQLTFGLSDDLSHEERPSPENEYRRVKEILQTAQAVSFPRHDVQRIAKWVFTFPARALFRHVKSSRR